MIYNIPYTEDFYSRTRDIILNLNNIENKNYSNILLIAPSSKVGFLAKKTFQNLGIIEPKVITLSEITPEFLFINTSGQCYYQMNCGEISDILRLNTISEIVMSFGIKRSDSIDLARNFIAIENAMLSNSISIADFQKIFEIKGINLAEKWIKNTELFHNTYFKWQEIKQKSKISSTFERTVQNIINFTESIQYFKKFQIFLLAPIGTTKIQSNLIKTLISLEHNIIFYGNEFNHDTTEYSIKSINFAKYIKNFSLSNSKIYEIKSNNALSEEHAIYGIINTARPHEKIGIITNNYKIAAQISKKLQTCGISICDTFGVKLAETSYFILFKTFAEIALFPNICISKVLHFLKSNYVQILDKSEIEKLEILYRNGNSAVFNGTINNLKLNKPDNQNQHFGQMLSELLENFTKITHSDPKTIEILEFEKFCRELEINLQNLKTNDPYDFITILTKYSQNRYYRQFDTISHNPSVYIVTPGEARTLKFDITIFASMNHGIFPSDGGENSMISNSIQHFFDIKHPQYKIDLRDLLELLHSSSRIYLSYFKYDLQQKDIQKSQFIDLISTNNATHQCKIHHKELQSRNTNHRKEIPKFTINSEHIPRILYATQIEQFMRNPYVFCIKTILEIKPLKSLIKIYEKSDFGNIIHNMLHKMTHNTDLTLEDLASDLPQNAEVKSWFTYNINGIYEIINKIKSEIIVLKNSGTQILTEHHFGSYKISNEFFVRSVLDRVDISTDCAVAIDYKTGSIKTSDVKIGLYAQLQIAEFILSDQNQSKNISSCYYFIKMNSGSIILESYKFHSPEQTKSNLEKIFSYFINIGEFKYSLNDIYQGEYHLSRVTDVSV